MTNSVKAYGVNSAGAALIPMTIERRALNADDVLIEIEYCGVCHSDLHFVKNDWGFSRYPLVPGHEIIGRVRGVGSSANQFQIGERVGVGCMVDSCRQCQPCQQHLEQFCDQGPMLTYSSESPDPGGSTFGGYATQIVVSEAFVLRIPEHLDPAAAAPLLCAGITTFSPLQYWRVGAGQKVGVIGLGGLGHMGIKFARAMGAQVVMITRSADKQKDAQHLGAHEVLLSNDDAAMAEHAGSFDFLLDTIPVEHDVNPYLKLLKHSATLCIVGAVGPIGVVDTANLVLARRNIAGSMIGGIAETQQMLDFCGEHQLTAEVEVIDINTINQAYQRMQRSDVKYRFVIDMATLSKS